MVIRQSKAKDWILIIIGALLMAMGTNLFFVQHDLVTGGVLGIGIIIRNFVVVPLWLTNLLFNIPLFLFAVLIKGKRFGIKSLFGTIALTVALYITEFIPIPTEDMLLSAVFGGALNGLGLGLVFSGFGTTGGSDLLAVIVQHFNKHISVAKVLGIIDFVIILSGAYVFGVEKSLYALIAVFISTKVMDGMLEGVNFAKAVYIISDNYEVISEKIIKRMDRGVTALNGMGMFKHSDKKVLLCVMSSKQLPTLKELVISEDPRAFVVVFDAKEALGEGFGSV